MGATTFGAASAAVGALSVGRRVALRDSLEGRSRLALDRYLLLGRSIEARWLVLRVLGICVTAVLLSRLMPESLGRWAALVAALASLVVYGVPAEVLKTILLRSPERTAPLLLLWLRPFEWLAAPLAAPLVLTGRLVGESVGKNGSIPPDARVTETEVELLVAESEQSGALDHEQSEMIRNVLEFRELTAEDVMVPRTAVTAIDVETPVSDVVALAMNRGHSRYPVYRERIDNVIGLLHTKDLLTHVGSSAGLASLELEPMLRRPVAFVPETQLASIVLADMRAGRHHLAIVIDEHGGMAGIVTLEDLIEEIVGEIRDEHDTDEPSIVELEDGRFLVDAALPIGELERLLGTDLPEDGDYHSLGGFLIERMGRVPRPGSKLVALDHEFVVRDADARHIARVEISPARSRSDGTRPVTAA
ncbi:MAG: HlyC/CorC family transporter [Polyangiaceae bacterium]|nr:HlyC/CorC family transporter [Polyangiaceae bacterium]